VVAKPFGRTHRRSSLAVGEGKGFLGRKVERQGFSLNAPPLHSIHLESLLMSFSDISPCGVTRMWVKEVLRLHSQHYYIGLSAHIERYSAYETLETESRKSHNLVGCQGSRSFTSHTWTRHATNITAPVVQPSDRSLSSICLHALRHITRCRW
jgi:hypothetical protein